MVMDDPDIKLSKFNDGQLQTLRLHVLQDKIHSAIIHLTHFFDEEQLYGYQLGFEGSTRLFMESVSKCTSEEIDKILSMRREINDFLEKNPVHTFKPNHVNHQPELIINYDSAKILKEGLLEYEKEIRIALATHGLSSPEKPADIGGWD